MDCYTDRPGVQFYSGNFLSGKIGKSVYNKHAGFCLETQLYPDCINKSKWKSPVLKKDDKFYSRTEYCFSIRKND
jgi:aldose 1-epimerase